MAKKKTKKKTKKTKKRAKRKVMALSVSDAEYTVENAANTLMRANEINSQPVLLRKAKALLKRRQSLIGKTINGK